MILSKEERERRCRESFAKRGIDYDRYCEDAENRKLEKLRLKQENIERNMYRPNHEDNIQFGCCPPDVSRWF